MRRIVLIVHNVRSCHNVGALLRTAEGLGVERVILSGYTPYPAGSHDSRLPHQALAQHKQIRKTALGAETFVRWEHCPDVAPLLEKLRTDGFRLIALEQTPEAVELPQFRPPPRLALVVGREVEGIEPDLLALMDEHVHIPMLGHKESFNVAAAAAMALYHCRFSKN